MKNIIKFKVIIFLSVFHSFITCIATGHRWAHLDDKCYCPHIEAIEKYFNEKQLKGLKMVLGAGTQNHDFEYDKATKIGPRFPGYNFLVNLGAEDERCLFKPTNECRDKKDISSEIEQAYQKLATLLQDGQKQPLLLPLDFTMLEHGFGQFCEEMKGQFKEITFDSSVMNDIHGKFNENIIQKIQKALSGGGKFYLDAHHPSTGTISFAGPSLISTILQTKYLTLNGTKSVIIFSEKCRTAPSYASPSFFLNRLIIPKDLLIKQSLTIDPGSMSKFGEDENSWIFPSQQLYLEHLECYAKRAGFDKIEYFESGYPLPTFKPQYDFSKFKFFVATKNGSLNEDLSKLKDQSSLLKNKLVLLNEKLINLHSNLK